jgi:chromatin remodeling complex protein RSC6
VIDSKTGQVIVSK